VAPVVLLGPQRREPTLPRVVRELGLSPPYAVVTAGWHEREGETAEMGHDLGGPVNELWLYRRAHEVFEKDPNLRLEHRRRQDMMRRIQEIYRARLGYAQAAARDVFGLPDHADIVEIERENAIEAVRALDRHHVERVDHVRESFRGALDLEGRPLIRHHRAEIARTIEEAGAVLVAGGHVATLINRMRLFDLGPLLAGKPVVAWSAGAMAVSELVVLFHDSPPQGPGDAEVVDRGLGVARGVLPLPHATRRLHLDDHVRVAMLARRFAALEAVTLDEGARLDLEPRHGQGVRTLRPDGTLA
jgi:hypothetical protein